jgi:hypothetical protein
LRPIRRAGILVLPFAAGNGDALERAGLRYYITEGPAGSVTYDHMVIARARVGCLR